MMPDQQHTRLLCGRFWIVLCAIVETVVYNMADK